MDRMVPSWQHDPNDLSMLDRRQKVLISIHEKLNKETITIKWSKNLLSFKHHMPERWILFIPTKQKSFGEKPIVLNFKTRSKKTILRDNRIWVTPMC